MNVGVYFDLSCSYFTPTALNANLQGANHLGRLAYPGVGGSWKTGHLLLFLKELNC